MSRESLDGQLERERGSERTPELMRIAEIYVPHVATVSGLGRDDLPERTMPDCPWCGKSGGAAVVHVSVRTASGGYLAGPGFPGFLHRAHLSCLPDEIRQELHESYAAEYEDPESPGSYLCRSCREAVESYEDAELEALPRAPAGEPCWSCLQTLEESEALRAADPD